jgi:multicomponent Na+:H+ antiporter subunit F
VSPFLVALTLVVAGLIALGLRRVWLGPTIFDRLVAVALVTVNGVVVLVLLGFIFERAALFLDIALAYALLAFVLPIAVARYFEQRERADRRWAHTEQVLGDGRGSGTGNRARRHDDDAQSASHGGDDAGSTAHHHRRDDAPRGREHRRTDETPAPDGEERP